jgi:predicted kinase
VLDFYLAYRAWVRAKVAAFVACDDQAPHAVRIAKRQEARRTFALTRALGAKPFVTPGLVAVGGIIGSGKSTLAAALGAALAAPVVGSDRTRKSLAGLAATAPGGDELYTPARTEATYAELLRRAGVILDSGRTVIVDATFESALWRGRAAELAASRGARFAFLEAACPDWNVLRQRLRARALQPSISDAREALLDRLIAEGRAPRLSSSGDARIIVDTRATLAAAAAVEELRRLGIAAPEAL